MRGARHSVDIEAYIFHQGRVTREVLDVLAERARSGVQVNLVIDSLGSLSTRKTYFPAFDRGGRKSWLVSPIADSQLVHHQ